MLVCVFSNSYGVLWKIPLKMSELNFEYVCSTSAGSLNTINHYCHRKEEH